MAMAISMIVLLGVGSVFVTSKRTSIVQEEFARMQEGANFAFQFLTQDLRQAGYAGCNPVIKSMLNTSSNDTGLFDFASGIYGWEADGTNPGSTVTDPSTTTPSSTASDWDDHNSPSVDLHSTMVGSVLPGTDVIVVKSTREIPNLIPSTNTTPTSASVTFGSSTGINMGQIVMLSDCEKADLFMNGTSPSGSALTRAAGCGGYTPCNVTPSTIQWSHEYKTSTVRVLTTTSRAYFIGVGASGEPALFRISYNQGIGAAAAPEELIEGVENMQILYGEDLNATDNVFLPTRFVPMSAVTDINNVIAVRISLLMRTTRELDRPDDTRTYLLAGVTPATGTTINPVDDKRMRKTFTTTVTLRNKMVVGRQVDN